MPVWSLAEHGASRFLDVFVIFDGAGDFCHRCRSVCGCEEKGVWDLSDCRDSSGKGEISLVAKGQAMP